MRHIGLAFLLMITSVLISRNQPSVAAAEQRPVIVIAAGVPKYLGETRDYDRIFAELASAGVTAFLATSQYQEIPAALALDYEVDFLPPCKADSPAFTAMRKHKIQLIVPGALLYPPGAFPPLAEDPLRSLLDCLGKDLIFAVFSVDEPVNALTDATDPVKNVRELYERVKQVAPQIPVMMVHAPLPSETVDTTGTTRPTTQAELDAYLRQVEQFSVYADIIGFDVYPIPPEIAAVPAPGLGTRRVNYPEAFPAYLDWLKEVAAGRPVFMVLQGFSYARLLDAATAQEAVDAGFDLRFPTQAELREMACLTAASDGMIAWWGQSHLVEEDAAFWGDLLAVTEGVTADPSGYCVAEVS